MAMQGMQKKYRWMILGLIITLILAFIFWLKPQYSNPETLAQQANTATQPVSHNDIVNPAFKSPNSQRLSSPSQQDTQINCQIRVDSTQRLVVNAQTKDCFEYFISQYGEKDLAQIKTDFIRYAKNSVGEPALSQLTDLWSRYLDYRAKIASLNSNNLTENDPQYYETIFSNLQKLRQQLFSSYEIEGLFGIEDSYNQYTLKRMAVMADQHLTEVQKAQQLKALFEQLPSEWKENLEQLNKLEDLRKLTAAIKARNGSAAEIQQMRINLVGAEVTQRLENLDSQRNDWKNKVERYLSARDTIVQSGMSDAAKQQAIQQLRDQNFAKKQEQLRLSTFESVHDQGGKLPFFE